ncbi:hypothetical protein AB835_07460 [Candidatus Endobugula sertula]|uniref:Uncharacterized protein n=1 Tax=Candidatus Endobugula sertula TaxID=62101 RepID=A0A1D2QQ68_9GAMM|nr:hypothetical protein AB835_07460 [Candidatus Endobugula sertula]
MITKAYESVTTAKCQQWLDWHDFAGISTEGRLSRLCDCVLQSEAKELVYGLILPHKTISLGSGSDHQDKVLRELALYEKTEGNQ